MSKNQKLILNVFLIFTILASIAWGTVARGLGTWGTRTYSTWWNDDIFWANVCQLLIPAIIIILLVFINKKK